jgi:hypothetical protein
VICLTSSIYTCKHCAHIPALYSQRCREANTSTFGGYICEFFYYWGMSGEQFIRTRDDYREYCYLITVREREKLLSKEEAYALVLDSSLGKEERAIFKEVLRRKMND